MWILTITVLLWGDQELLNPRKPTPVSSGTGGPKVEECQELLPRSHTDVSLTSAPTFSCPCWRRTWLLLSRLLTFIWMPLINSLNQNPTDQESGKCNFQVSRSYEGARKGKGDDVKNCQKVTVEITESRVVLKIRAFCFRA